MKKSQYKWFGLLLPQIALLPLAYIGTTEASRSFGLKFWIAPIMLYILYVCFANIRKSNSKTQFEKVKRNIYSGFLTYVMLSVYLAMTLLKNPNFKEQILFVVLFALLQISQYVILVIQYQKMKKIS